MYKIFKLGFNGKIWRLICDSFCNVSCCVLYGGTKSEEYPVLQGVGQGRVLSAWFFLVMINDLAVELDHLRDGIMVSNLHIPCILLADDTLLLAATIMDMRK